MRKLPDIGNFYQIRFFDTSVLSLFPTIDVRQISCSQSRISLITGGDSFP